MSMARMSSVEYLTSHIAVSDGQRPKGSPMTRYYGADGYPPGTWLGSGLGALGEGTLHAGDQVTEQQLRALFENGRDPVTSEQIGNAAAVYLTRAERVERRERDDPDPGQHACEG